MVAVAVAPRPLPGLEEVLRRAGLTVAAPDDAAALVWTSPGEHELLARMLRPHHRWVSLPVAGVDGWLASGVLDRERIWTCARGVYASGVAEHALALVLAGARRLGECARATSWQRLPGRRLAGSTVVVLGAGTIGRQLALLSALLGVRLIALNRKGMPVDGFAATRPSSELGAAAGEADFLVVTAPLTPETEHMVDRPVLRALGPSGWLVNVARGKLVDTAALVEALEAGELGGAALDVTDPEPLPDDHPLWHFRNVLLTPHVANPNYGNPWDSHLPELLAHLETNARRFARGEALAGTIDLEAGY